LSVDYCDDNEEYVDSIRLNIKDTEQLPDSIKYDTLYGGGEIDLTETQVILLRNYMKDNAICDLSHCSYTLCLNQESWLIQQIREKQELLIPDPKSVFCIRDFGERG